MLIDHIRDVRWPFLFASAAAVYWHLFEMCWLSGWRFDVLRSLRFYLYLQGAHLPTPPSVPDAIRASADQIVRPQTPEPQPVAGNVKDEKPIYNRVNQ